MRATAPGEPSARRRFWVRAVSANVWLSSAGLGLLCSPGSVLAHAGPQVRDIRPEGETHSQLLVSNRGLIFRSAESANWQLMCNEALGVSTVETPDVAVLSDGRLLAGTVRGLKVSGDTGCSWQGVEPFAALTVPSLMQHPTQPDRVYITTYGSGESGLRTTSDGGANWQTLLSVADSDYLRFIRIAAGQPEHLYVRSLRFGTGSAFVYSVLHSSDAGQNWQRHDVSLTETETDLALLAVSPSDANLLVAMAEATDPTQPERLLVSHDGGESFTAPLQARVITAAAWSSDGQTLWIGADQGLWRSTDGARTFERVGTAEYISCVLERDGQLLACGFYRGVSAGHPGIGVSNDGGETFDRWMGLSQVGQPIACPAGAPTSTACATLWVDWQREILGTVDGNISNSDAGAINAGAQLDADTPQDASAMVNTHAEAGTNDAGSAKHVTAGCGCQLLATGMARLPLGWLPAGLWLGLWQRSRVRRVRSRGISPPPL